MGENSPSRMLPAHGEKVLFNSKREMRYTVLVRQVFKFSVIVKTISRVSQKSTFQTFYKTSSYFKRISKSVFDSYAYSSITHLM